MSWKVGSRVGLNVYDGDRPVCQCHNAEDAANIVAAMNGKVIVKDEFPVFSTLGVVATIAAVVFLLAFAIVGFISAVTGHA